MFHPKGLYTQKYRKNKHNDNFYLLLTTFQYKSNFIVYQNHDLELYIFVVKHMNENEVVQRNLTL